MSDPVIIAAEALHAQSNFTECAYAINRRYPPDTCSSWHGHQMDAAAVLAAVRPLIEQQERQRIAAMLRLRGDIMSAHAQQRPWHDAADLVESGGPS